jgi:hypothetical protein
MRPNIDDWVPGGESWDERYVSATKRGWVCTYALRGRDSVCINSKILVGTKARSNLRGLRQLQQRVAMRSLRNGASRSLIRGRPNYGCSFVKYSTVFCAVDDTH